MKAIEEIYERSENEEITGEGLTGKFRTGKGVKAGLPV